MKRINIFFGNYGSGKTEISLATAIKLKEQCGSCLLIDLDIVNPYFRSSDSGIEGIEIISPNFAGTAVDVPALSAKVNIAFETDQCVVIDCGGDSAGATALGAYADKIHALGDAVEIYFVVNARRPFQEDVASIVESMGIIEHVSKLSATALINNTNLADDTSPEDILFGEVLLKDVAEQKGIPIAYTVGTQAVLDELGTVSGEKFVLAPRMRPYWQV